MLVLIAYFFMSFPPQMFLGFEAGSSCGLIDLCKRSYSNENNLLENIKSGSLHYCSSPCLKGYCRVLSAAAEKSTLNYPDNFEKLCVARSEEYRLNDIMGSIFKPPEFV